MSARCARASSAASGSRTSTTSRSATSSRRTRSRRSRARWWAADAVVVGLITWELHLAACQSLKEKRHVLKSLKDRLHNRFNVSAAETDHHDLWQRAELSVCVVSTDREHAERVMREADRLVRSEEHTSELQSRLHLV